MLRSFLPANLDRLVSWEAQKIGCMRATSVGTFTVIVEGLTIFLGGSYGDTLGPTGSHPGLVADPA